MEPARYTGIDAKCGESVSKPDMRVSVAGVELRSPVIAASGTFGYGVEFEEIVSLDRIGAFVTKGLSKEPMAGNASPRIIETAAGMMNTGSALAAILSPIAFGFIIDRTGNWQLPFAGSLGFLLLGALLAPIMHPERPFEELGIRN